MSAGEWVQTVLILGIFGLVLGQNMGVLGPIRHRKGPDLDAVIASKVRSRVIVTLKTGQVFAGVVVEADDQAWVLRSADALGAADDHSDLPVDGEIILMTADIAYAQKP